MENFNNYVYIVTRYEFIINLFLIILTISSIYVSFFRSLPSWSKTFFIFSGGFLLALILLRFIFFSLLDNEQILSNQCAPYFSDNMNFWLALYIAVINLIAIAIKYLFNFKITEILAFALILALAMLLAYHSYHFSIPRDCKTSEIPFLNNFWSSN